MKNKYHLLLAWMLEGLSREREEIKREEGKPRYVRGECKHCAMWNKKENVIIMPTFFILIKNF